MSAASRSAKDPSLESLLKQAEALTDPQKALAVVEKATSLYPDSPLALQRRGTLLIVLGRLDEAPAFLEKARMLDSATPDLLASYFLLGCALQDRGDNQEAAKLFNIVGDIPPDGVEMETFLIRRAVAWNVTSQPARALEALNRAEPGVKDANSRAVLFLHKGIALRQVGEYGSAIEALDLAAQSLPRTALFNCTVQKATALNSLGRYREGFDLLDALLHEPGSAAQLPLLLGFAFCQKAVALAGLKRFQEAVESYEQAEKANPVLKTDLEFWYVTRDVLLCAGRNPDVLADPPAEIASHPFVISVRGSIHVTLGQPEKGREELARAATPLQAYAEDPFAWFGVAIANFGLMRPAESAAASEKACQLNPALRASLWLYLSFSYWFLERYEEAWKEVEALPDIPMVLLVKSFALEGLGKAQEALDKLEQAIPSLPETPPQTMALALIRKGYILLQLGLSSQSLEAFHGAVDFTSQLPETDALVLVAQVGIASCLIKLDRREDALQSLTRATRFDPPAWVPNRAIGWWLQGKLLAQMDRGDEALYALRRAETLQPESAEIRVSHGETLLALEDYESAERVFSEAIVVAKKEEVKFDASVGKGDALNRLERYEAAIEAYRGAVPNLSAGAHGGSTLWLGMGEAYRCLGRLRAALQTFRRGWSLDKRPKKSSGLAVGIAAVLLAMKRDEDAAAFLTDAKTKALPDPRIAFNLGVARYRLKQRAAAQQCWREAAGQGLLEAKACLEDMRQRNLHEASDWFGFWFGPGASTGRMVLGSLLALFLLAVGALFVVNRDSVSWLSWLKPGLDYKVLSVPLAVVLLMLFLPALTKLKFGLGPLKLEAASPESHQKPEIDTLVDKLPSMVSSLTASTPLGSIQTIGVRESMSVAVVQVQSA